MTNVPGNGRPEGKSRPVVTGDLASRIERARDTFRAGQVEAEGRDGGRTLTGMGRAMRLGTEFIAAILVGTAIGYFLDRWLATGPWLMLVMLLVGFAAGVLNVVRSAGDMNRANPAPKDADLGPDEDDA